MTLDFSPSPIAVPQPVLDDLHERLARTRLPNQLAGVDWQMGTELGYLETLLAYWKDTFDWRAQEARFNEFEPTVTEVDGQRIHFLHARSPEPDALPLLISHGWPGSVTEFLDVLGPLSNPRAHGGDPADAFHVVAPSLPGYGFSGPTLERGWHPRRMAASVHADHVRPRLRAVRRTGRRLGLDRVAERRRPRSRARVRIAPQLHHRAEARRTRPNPPRASTPSVDAVIAFRTTGAGYQEIQGTKPQTVGYSLEDSPSGLCAWIVEKFTAWTDCDGNVEREFTKDQLLTNITVYWATATATSSARLYYEMRQAGREAIPQAYVGVPTGVANYPGEVTRTPRSWAEHRYNITHWTDQPHGGHFAAMQVPDLFVADVREFFRTVR